MEKSTKSTIVKSISTKSTPTKSTPQKRKQDSFSGIQKKAKFDLSYIEEECKKTYLKQIPCFVMSMGSGDTGQLGLGEDILEKKRPAVISDLTDIIEVRAGAMHSVCLSKRGNVYTFGCNDEGALGRVIVEDEEATVPGEVTLPDQVKAIDITAGDSHSSALSEDGKVYIWGSFRDNNGFIGLLKPFEKLVTPTLVPVNKKIIKIASGENHFAMLTEHGEVLTFGCAEQGQLGRVSPNNLIRGGRGGLLPLLVPSPVRVRQSVKFCDLWAGSFCTVARSTDGEIYGCGLNNYKQLGIEDELLQLMMTSLGEFNNLKDNWIKFVFGQHHTMALTESKKIYVIGRGEYGNLGQGDNEHQSKVTEVKLESNDILTIAACNRTSYALMNDGTIFSWGMGSSYQLGHGDDEDVNIPTKMVGKQIVEKKVIDISPGFQHVLFRAIQRDVPVEQIKNDEKIDNILVQNQKNEKIETIEEVNQLESKETEVQEEKFELKEKIKILSTQTVVSSVFGETNFSEKIITTVKKWSNIEEPQNSILECVEETLEDQIAEDKEANKIEINDSNNNAREQMEVEENQES